MSVLKIFKNYTPVALWGATGPKCNFFLQICNKVLDRGRTRARGPQRATGGPVAPPRATGVPPI